MIANLNCINYDKRRFTVSIGNEMKVSHSKRNIIHIVEGGIDYPEKLKVTLMLMKSSHQRAKLVYNQPDLGRSMYTKLYIP